MTTRRCWRRGRSRSCGRRSMSSPQPPVHCSAVRRRDTIAKLNGLPLRPMWPEEVACTGRSEVPFGARGACCSWSDELPGFALRKGLPGPAPPAPARRHVYLVQPKFPPSYWGLEHFLELTPYRAVFPPLGLLT